VLLWRAFSHFAWVYPVLDAGLVRLASKAVCHRFNGGSLVGLGFKLQFHFCVPTDIDAYNVQV
jgi:hypothetical protein